MAEHIKVLPHTTIRKKGISQQLHSNLGWRNAPYSPRTHATIPRARGILPGTTRQGDQIHEPATPKRDAYLRSKSQSTTVYHNGTKLRSGHQYCILSVPYVSVRVTRGDLVAHRYTYAPPHGRTSQYRRPFIPRSVSCGTFLLAMY